MNERETGSAVAPPGILPPDWSFERRTDPPHSPLDAAPSGERLGMVDAPETSGNLTFSHLEPYLNTAASSLYRLPVSVKGARF